jgi:Cu-processing system permease protein
MIRVGKYVVYDLIRSRFVLIYSALLMAITLTVVSMDSDVGKSTLSLLNIVLLVVPIVSATFTAIHFYNSYEFIELLLSQPVARKTVFFAEYFAVAIALSLAFLLGAGIPLLIMNFSDSSVYLVIGGVLLTFVFVALAFAASVSTRDKAKGIGIALLLWFYFAVIYDGFVLYVIYAFNEYPLEKVTLALISLNPVDLTRILILLKLDLSALMGYTGAFYQRFFGSGAGTLYSAAFVMVWIAIPMFYAWRRFAHKDI